MAGAEFGGQDYDREAFDPEIFGLHSDGVTPAGANWEIAPDYDSADPAGGFPDDVNPNEIDEEAMMGEPVESGVEVAAGPSTPSEVVVYNYHSRQGNSDDWMPTPNYFARLQPDVTVPYLDPSSVSDQQEGGIADTPDMQALPSREAGGQNRSDESLFDPDIPTPEGHYQIVEKTDTMRSVSITNPNSMAIISEKSKVYDSTGREIPHDQLPGNILLQNPYGPISISFNRKSGSKFNVTINSTRPDPDDEDWRR